MYGGYIDISDNTATVLGMYSIANIKAYTVYEQQVPNIMDWN